MSRSRSWWFLLAAACIVEGCAGGTEVAVTAPTGATTSAHAPAGTVPTDPTLVTPTTVGAAPTTGTSPVVLSPPTTPLPLPCPERLAASIVPRAVDQAPAYTLGTVSRGSRYCVVAVDNATGAIAGTVYAVPIGYYPGWVALSADATTAYVYQYAAAQEDPCDRHIVRVALESGTVDPFVDGSYPVISADGRRMAYLADAWARTGTTRTVGLPPYRCGHEAIVIRDLATGHEDVIVGKGPWTSDLAILDWSPDGRYLRVEQWGDDVGYPTLLDLTNQASSAIGATASFYAQTEADKVYVSFHGFVRTGGFVAGLGPDARYTNVGKRFWAFGALDSAQPCLPGAGLDCFFITRRIDVIALSVARAGGVSLVERYVDGSLYVGIGHYITGGAREIKIPAEVYSLVWPAGTMYIDLD